ncbi:hypothetical protein BGZ47_011420 [Haplosporangium gracile]|nr:hypothetical protein BGZ47_011420 [Haplosporangium gracile]
MRDAVTASALNTRLKSSENPNKVTEEELIKYSRLGRMLRKPRLITRQQNEIALFKKALSVKTFPCLEGLAG